MKCKALTPIDYNNKRYEIGKTIEVADEHIDELLAAKAIELPAKHEKNEK